MENPEVLFGESPHVITRVTRSSFQVEVPSEGLPGKDRGTRHSVFFVSIVFDLIAFLG
jgi:hypothetical protein